MPSILLTGDCAPLMPGMALHAPDLHIEQRRAHQSGVFPRPVAAVPALARAAVPRAGGVAV